MAQRVYIVLARNDIEDNLLQVLDLKPNSSQRNPCIDGAGQTGYLTWYRQNSTVATTAGGGGIRTTNAAYQGVAAYIIDNVENVQGGNLATTAAQANTIAAAILARVAAGSSLTLAAINTIINAAFGGLASSDLNGVVAGSWSTGTVEHILRILGGEVYNLPASSQVGNAGNAFPGHGVGHTRLGGFVASTSALYRNVREFAWTGELNLSCLSGVLSKLKAATYSWINPSYTYGATGTALTISGGQVPATGVAPAVVVYEADGDVL